MSRFVLIDHSISDLAGHHYEYAVHVLGAAQRAGYEPVLVTNRKFRAAQDIPWQVLPVYEFGFWPEPKSSRVLKLLAKAKVRWQSARLKRLVALRYSFIGLAWISRARWQDYLATRPVGWRRTAAWLAGLLLIVLTKILRTAALIAMMPFVIILLVCQFALVPFKYLFGLLGVLAGRVIGARVPPFFRRYFATLSLEFRTYKEAISVAFRGLGAYGARVASAGHAPSSQHDAFARDTEALVNRLSPGRGDVIFIPTISFEDMVALGAGAASHSSAADCTWHLLFRRNIFTGRRASYPSQDSRFSAERSMFELYRNNAIFRNSYFYTDTIELTEQYNRLGVVPFHTLPIPHTYSAQDCPARSGPLRFTYLGDARREKGFHFLPHLAMDLWDYLNAGKIRFALQSNFNIPGGEPEAALTVPHLRSFPPDQVSLFDRPLTSEQYKVLLLSADLNLLMYDPLNYYARSSGVLAEALAIGVPVLVPSGCWLSRQFLEPHYDYLESLPAKLEISGSSEGAEIRWERHGEHSKGTTPYHYGLNELTSTYEQPSICFLSTPARSTHLLVSFTLTEGSESLLKLCELDSGGVPLTNAVTYELESAGHTRRAACLIAVGRNCRRVWLSLGPSERGATLRFANLRFKWLCAPPNGSFPLSAVGLIYYSVSEVAPLVRNLIEHYPHYRKTATKFSDSWRALHNADRLIADLGPQSNTQKSAPKLKVEAL